MSPSAFTVQLITAKVTKVESLRIYVYMWVARKFFVSRNNENTICRNFVLMISKHVFSTFV